MEPTQRRGDDALTPRPRGGFGAAGLGVQLALGLLGPVVMSVLVVQFFDVYFTIGSTPREASAADEARYLATATIGVALAAASVILAVFRRRLRAFLAAGALIVGMIGVAYLLAIPQGRWTPVQSNDPLPADYVPCFSGSGNCPGG